MSKDKYIGYRPTIDYKEDYETNRGNYEYNIDSVLDEIQAEDFIESDPIQDNIEIIDKLLNGAFPSKLKDSILEIYNPIKDIYNEFLKNQPIFSINNNTKYINNKTEDATYGVYFNTKFLSVKVGHSKSLKAYVIPTTDISNKIEKWESSNSKIATVDDFGCITGISKGNVIIRATSTYDKYCDCLVSVLENEKTNTDIKPDSKPNKPDKDIHIIESEDTEDDTVIEEIENNIVHVTNVSLDRTNIILKVGQRRKMIASIYPKNVTNNKLIWSSNKKNIATVNQYGEVQGVFIGECTITVSSEDGNKTDTCNVKVIADDVNIISPPNKPGSVPDFDYDYIDPDEPIPDDPIVTVIPSIDMKPIPETITMEFLKNLSDLIEYYVSELKNIVSKYYKILTTELVKSSDSENFSFLYNNINVSNKDIVNSYRHVLDSSLKDEKISVLKTNFLSNSFNFNQTLYHLKSFIFAYKTREKYYSIPYSDNVDMTNSYSNNVLKACRIDSNLKYDKAYENLYRYMNSSLKLTDNVVNDTVQGILKKGILLKKGGI